MKKVVRIAGVAAPLALANVDTDVIIRVERLGRCPRDQLGDWSFAPLRFRPDGSENPAFILNQPGWRRAPILVAGANFGCGSSREHAVWALQGMGIECVIAPSFGDIFRSNCFQNGMLPVQLPKEQAQQLLTWLEQEHHQGRPQSIEVDLDQLSIRWSGGADLAFDLEPRRRHALMEGLDAIGQTLTQAAQIDAWQARDRQQRPWIWQLPQSQSVNRP